MISLKIRNKLRQNIDIFYKHDGETRGCTCTGRSVKEIVCDSMPPQVKELVRRGQFILIEQRDEVIETKKAESEAKIAQDQSDRIAASLERHSNDVTKTKKITGG